jgi:hypothetical protein
LKPPKSEEFLRLLMAWRVWVTGAVVVSIACRAFNFLKNYGYNRLEFTKKTLHYLVKSLTGQQFQQHNGNPADHAALRPFRRSGAEAQQVQRLPEADALRTRIRKGIQNKSVQPEEKKKSSCKTSPKRIQFPRYSKGTGTFL